MAYQFSSVDAASWITAVVDEYITSPANNLGMTTGIEPAFGKPLIGCAAGDDALWLEYKEHVGEFHWTPKEAFALAYPESPISPEELTVISWVLPQTAATCAEQRSIARLAEKDRMPGERWIRARVLGEPRVNAGLRRYLLEMLRKEGVQAVSPSLLPEWSRKDSDRFVVASTWSERHAAYAAGLGTFGLCDGLITPVGKAMRVGSVIARVRIPATPRPYTDHQEYCLFFSSGTCGKCIDRCPVGALSEKGHDKVRCRDFTRGVVTPYILEKWGLDGYGCGLCQVGIPCEKGIPPKPRAC